jgi:cell division protein FtsW (lipid II flippase)
MEITKRKETSGRFTEAALFISIVLFGVVLPNSFSNHERLLHFCAHTGMSFLLASCVYVVCSIRLQLSRKNSYIILFIFLFVIGSLYKYFEIRGERSWQHPASFGQSFLINGYYRSMSENLAGALMAILVIRYVISYQRRLRDKPKKVEAVASKD